VSAAALNLPLVVSASVREGGGGRGRDVGRGGSAVGRGSAHAGCLEDRPADGGRRTGADSVQGLGIKHSGAVSQASESILGMGSLNEVIINL
jgi:hypothetical protein